VPLRRLCTPAFDNQGKEVKGVGLRMTDGGNLLCWFFEEDGMARKNILMLVGDYVEDYEVMVAVSGVDDGGSLGACCLSGQESGRGGANGDS